MLERSGVQLLLGPVLALACGLGVLMLRHWPGIDSTVLALLAAVVVFMLGTEIFLSHRFRRTVKFFPIAVFLSCIGLLMTARLVPALFKMQLCWVLVGIVVFTSVVMAKKKVLALLDYQYSLGALCLILLILPLLFGTEIGGSRNWIALGSITIQPSEFGKIVLILFLAAYLADHRQVLTENLRRFFLFETAPLRFIAPLLLIWGLAMLMFVIARDLGSALLFFGIAVFMTYMATGSKSYVAAAMLFFTAASAVSYMLFSHVRVRVAIWLHPWQDPSGMAYQVVQSLFAIGTGGIWGVGYAHGNPDIIPAVHTDFVFSAIAEELGFLGMTAVLLGYLFLFYYAIQTALLQTRLVYTLIAAGCGTAFILQAFIIAAGVTKFLPLTGITLPFISYGGSSMIASFLMLALLTILEKEGNERVG